MVAACCDTPQNEEAEELMRHVEQEEEAAAAANPDALQLHLCIINLVIGTLYCSKVRRWRQPLTCLGALTDCVCVWVCKDTRCKDTAGPTQHTL
jgi:hypothetical protein